VRRWVDSTGCDWVSALLNSGVMAGSRHDPEQAARAEQRAKADEALEHHLRLITPLDHVGRRRRSAEHEASHAIVAQSFGAKVRVAYLGGDSGGAECIFDNTLTGLARATVALAPEPWFLRFRADAFPTGPTGMAQDRRDAAATDADLREAVKLATTILGENRAAVMSLADKIDRDGHWFGE
jgi:hypothetical protein